MKKCSNKKCLLEKEESEFCKNKNTKDGLSRWCCQCTKEYKKRYRQEAKEKINDYNRVYIAEQRKDEEFRKKGNAMSRDYYKRNKNSINARANKYIKQRRLEDECFRIKQNVSNMIKNCLKKQNTFGLHIWHYLYYTPQQLKENIESKWESWMTWENFGKASLEKRTWQIDHIIPQSKLLFDSFEHPNFLKCWSLENLRPLEAIENIKKGNKLIINE